jgi:hypothetical protein
MCVWIYFFFKFKAPVSSAMDGFVLSNIYSHGQRFMFFISLENTSPVCTVNIN